MNLRRFFVCLGIVPVLVACTAAFFSAPAGAEIFGNVHGIVHDPQHRPVQDAAVDLKGVAFGIHAALQKTNDNGEFDFQRRSRVGEYAKLP